MVTAGDPAGGRGKRIHPPPAASSWPRAGAAEFGPTRRTRLRGFGRVPTEWLRRITIRRMNPTEDTAEGRTAKADGTADAAADGERLDALIALYGADRDKVATLANERLALLAIQMTYLGLAIIALGGVRPLGGAWVAAFTAAPLWFMNAHHQVLVAAALTRSRSVNLLENLLFERSGLDPTIRHRVGHRAGALVRDLATQPLAFKVQAVVAYAGIGAALLAITVYALAVAASQTGWGSPPVVLAILFYAVFTATALIGWGRTARLPRV